MDKRHCKVCGELKDRIEVGKYNAKDKKYVDENNKLWNGTCCPPCHQKKMKEYVALKRKLNSEKVPE